MSVHWIKRWVYRCAAWIVILVLIISFNAPVVPFNSLAASPSEANFAAQPANPGSPQVLPANLPVFKLISPPVNTESIQALQRTLDGFSATIIISDTTHLDTIRFRGVMTDTGAVLDQFSASGGVFAYNNSLAFQEIKANLDYGPNQICDYLLSNQLFPQETTPEARDCQGTLPYTHELIYLNTLSLDQPAAPGEKALDVASSTTEVIGQVWHVPLAIDATPDLRTPTYVPLGGPGGHLSLLLTGYDERPPLDSDLPGLQGLAMPWFQRQHTILGYFPLISPQVAGQQLAARTQESMPGAVVDLGEPELVYYVDDPAGEQKTMAPMWIFPDASANVDGQMVNLKVSPVPGVDGFFPSVEIQSPADGASYLPGTPLDVQATISGSAPPFTYTLSLEDGTVLKTGTSPGGVVNIQADAAAIENKVGQPQVLVVLSVEDSNGAPALDQVSLLTPTPWLFLPAIQRNASSSAQAVQSFSTQNPLAPEATHAMGVDYIKYYNGTNNNLPGVPADANGFYSRMQTYGWSGSFKWANNDAWEKDWRDCSLGGGDCSYGVDRVDFAYFSGHGGPARIYFGVYKNTLDFFAGNARYQTLRWAAFSSCQTLRAGPYVSTGNPPLTHWFPAFQGAYMLLGFHSNMADIAFGAPFVDMMNGFYFFPFITIPKPAIREAWSMTAFLYNAGKPAYLYARSNSFNPVNMKLPGSGTSLPALTNIIEYRWVWWD